MRKTTWWIVLALTMCMVMSYGIGQAEEAKPIMASYRVTEQSLEHLSKENMPDEILQGLKKLESQSFFTRDDFLSNVKKHIGDEQIVKYKELILKYAQNVIVINVATVKQLTSLPGIDEKLARAIIEGRPYQSVRELKELPGIDYEQMLALCITDKVRLKMNLKSATKDELIRLPGIDAKRADQIIGECSSYKPYNLEKYLILLKDKEGKLLGDEGFTTLAALVEAPMVLNIATPEELAQLPDIDEDMARRIFKNRPYTKKEDLLSLSGMNKEKLAEVSEKIDLKLKLNTATLEELEALPVDLPSETAEAIITGVQDLEPKDPRAITEFKQLKSVEGMTEELFAALEDLTLLKPRKGWQPRKIFLIRETEGGE